MNLILVTKDDYISDQQVKLTDHRLTHILKVHRAEVGQTLKVGEINGLMGYGKVVELSKQGVILDLVLDTKPPESIELTLVIALPRPPTVKKILQGAIEMGVKQIHFIGAKRVEKSFWQSSLMTPEGLHKQNLLGLEQAVDTILPTITFHKYFKPFVSEVLPEFLKTSRGFIAHPTLDSPCPHQIDEPATVVIGPEGGFIPYEVELLLESGLTPVHLGSRILRVEHATFALISKLTQ
ncbi:MAG: 16S rRNA (uracil(1498)-N(3))-methyltransferase [Lentisphaeria bacterium]|nr:16S rRNA (uracil(1498)-N(3))-methyltransferase [Lentisphaeria bacterium]